MADVVDGNVEAVTIYTTGLRVQDVILAMLEEKYGDPSNLEEENKQNAFGAVFSSHLAQWLDFTNLTVSFRGTQLRTDVGIITVYTDKGGEDMLKRARQQDQVRSKF